MMKVARVSALIAFVLIACAVGARADVTTFGITLNGTTGEHIEPYRNQAIPFLPLPMVEIDHTHRQLHLHIEGMPPIGPVPLAESGSFDGSTDPRVSYLDGQALYEFKSLPLELGIGETILNQRTLYSEFNASQASRVVGMQWAGRAQLYERGDQRLQATLAVNPKLQGFQDGLYAERGSMVDSSLRWTIDRGAYSLSYGLRYLNYTAAYDAGNALADRNHLFMPFVGVDWNGRKGAPHETVDRDDPPPWRPTATVPSQTWFGMTLFGTNGDRTTTDAYSDAPLTTSLLPQFTLVHSFDRYEIDGSAILPSANPNPFGASLQEWSYLSVDALVRMRDPRLAFGLGETVSNLAPVRTAPFESSHSRSEAVDLVGRFTLPQTGRRSLVADVRVNPYVHISGYTAYDHPGYTAFSTVGYDHGARVDTSLAEVQQVGKLSLRYGLRYINQTSNYGALGLGGGVYLTRTYTLMPFVGIAVR